jgi:hypothetical protein
MNRDERAHAQLARLQNDVVIMEVLVEFGLRPIELETDALAVFVHNPV